MSIVSRQFFYSLFKIAIDFLSLKTLLSKFWWSFFVLSLVAVSVYVSVFAKEWSNYSSLRSQIVHWKSAERFKNHFFKGLNELNTEAAFYKIQEKLNEITFLYPHFDTYVYVPFEEKMISAKKIDTVSMDTSELDRFVSLEHIPPYPLTLSEPYFENGVHGPRIFSASKLSIKGQNVYLIVIIIGDEYLDITNRIVSTHISTLGVLLLISVIVICSVVSLLVYLLVLRRLGRVTNAIEYFTKGNYGYRINDTEHDELSIHVKAFNTLAETIERLIRALKKQDDVRRDLVANVSHELRRPLTTLQLSLDTIQETESGASKQFYAYIQQAISCSEELSRLISDLFELSKLDATEQPPKKTKVSLREICEDVIQQMEMQSIERNTPLFLCSQEDDYVVLVDEVLIQRAISNLLENAIKYTKPNDSIQIGLTRFEDSVMFEIKDTGVGIPKEDIEVIFERFKRGSLTNDSDSFTTGAGLGLAIASRIIELHGSVLSVESEVGVFTRFYFEIPYVSK